MAKKEEKNGTTAVAEQPEVNAIAKSEQQTVNAEQIGESLRKSTRGAKDSGYLTFEPGQKTRVLFIGWKPIPSKDTTQPAGTMVNAAVFITDEGRELINADTAIRSYFEKQTPGQCKREIECKGKTKGPKGEYKTFEFFELKD